jgi:hypothetical protein
MKPNFTPHQLPPTPAPTPPPPTHTHNTHTHTHQRHASKLCSRPPICCKLVLPVAAGLQSNIKQTRNKKQTQARPRVSNLFSNRIKCPCGHSTTYPQTVLAYRHNPSSPPSPTMFKCLLVAALIVSVAVAADVGELCADYANTTYNCPCLRSGLPQPALGGGGAGEGTWIMLPLSGPQGSCSRSVGPRTTSGKPDVPRTTITRRTWARVLLCAFSHV